MLICKILAPGSLETNIGIQLLSMIITIVIYPLLNPKYSL